MSYLNKQKQRYLFWDPLDETKTKPLGFLGVQGPKAKI